MTENPYPDTDKMDKIICPECNQSELKRWRTENVSMACLNKECPVLAFPIGYKIKDGLVQFHQEDCNENFTDPACDCPRETLDTKSIESYR